MHPCSIFSLLPVTGRWQKHSPDESCIHFERTLGSYTPFRARIDPPLFRSTPIPARRPSPEAPRPTPQPRSPSFPTVFCHLESCPHATRVHGEGLARCSADFAVATPSPPAPDEPR